MTTDIRPKPGTPENQCPDLLRRTSGAPQLDALGRPYRCELGIGHGGSVHAGGGVTWPVRQSCPECNGTGAVEGPGCNCDAPDDGTGYRHRPYCGLEPCPRGCPFVPAAPSTP